MENPSSETSVEAQNVSTINEPAAATPKARFRALQNRAREAGDLLRQRAERLGSVWGRLKNHEALPSDARQARELLRRRVERAPDAWRRLKDRPLLGVGIAVGSGLGLAALVGAAETAVALSAGVLAYQTLTRPSGSNS
jgi:hypothetical protein